MKKKEIAITTLIGKGAVCGGDFTAEGSVRIDGTINGSVKVTGSLIVGAAGAIYGDVEAAGAMIGGEIQGNVVAPEKVELTATAKVIGDIQTATIVIDEKAIFQGKCDMNQETGTKRPRPSARAVRAGKRSAKAAIAEALKEVAAENRTQDAEEKPAESKEEA